MSGSDKVILMVCIRTSNIKDKSYEGINELFGYLKERIWAQYASD